MLATVNQRLVYALLNLRFNSILEVAHLNDLLLQLSGHVLLLDLGLARNLFVEESVKDQVQLADSGILPFRL